MANYTFVELDLEQARLLGDLAGIRLDLEAAKRFARRLEQIFAAGLVDSDLVDALTTAILVRYARSFTSGVRTTLQQEHTSQLTETQRGLHERFICWRSKHIAHSVNPFEQNRVVARYVSESGRDVGIQDVSVQQDRLIGLGSQDLSDLKDLIEAHLSIVDSQYEQERVRVLELVRKIPVDSILDGEKTPTTAGIESVKESRPR